MKVSCIQLIENGNIVNYSPEDNIEAGHDYKIFKIILDNGESITW